MSFGSPAADYVETKLDLNQLLIQHPAASYFVRMDSDRLLSEGIRRGDILVVDRSLSPRRGGFVIVNNGPEFQVCRFRGLPYDHELVVWGVITSVIRQMY